jgi:hypothetical protein
LIFKHNEGAHPLIYSLSFCIIEFGKGFMLPVMDIARDHRRISSMLFREKRNIGAGIIIATLVQMYFLTHELFPGTA